MKKVDEADIAASKAAEDWSLIDALRGGTPGMRAAGEKYLPRRKLEEQGDYQRRLAMTTLFPAFTETVATMTGRVFAEPLVVGESVSAWIRDEVVTDVDLQGRNLHVFAKDWFDEALSYGLSHVLVESPRADGVRTREDQVKRKVRPYLIQIHPRQILGWKIDAGGQLAQVRIAWSRIEDDGEFGQRQVSQVRVYEPGRVRTFEKQGEVWVVAEDVATGVNGIPLATLYTKRTGLLQAEPPLRELAYLNAKHWAMQSSNDALVDTASVPILAMFGVNDSDEIVIGAKHAVRLPAGADMKFVEHTGAAIGAGRESLDALKEEMRQAGAKLLAPQAGQAKTASQANEEAARENSTLGAMAMALEDTLALVLDVIAAYRGEASGGTVKLQPNLDAEMAPAESMNTLLGMAREGALSYATVFSESKRRGLVADDVEWDDEQERIREQGDVAP